MNLKDRMAQTFFRVAIENGAPVLKKDADAWADRLIETMEAERDEG